jgi:hypothetical protein
MRNRLLQGVHRFFTSYVWMIAGLWLFLMVTNIILGFVVFSEARGGTWYFMLGGTLGCVIGMIAVTILKLVFHKRVIRALETQNDSSA